MENNALLHHICERVELNADERALVAAKITKRTYKKGQYVVQHGDVDRFQSYVISGCIRTYYIDPDGGEHTVQFAIEDWWTGDLGSFITQQPARYNVQCLENTTVAQLNNVDMEMMYKEVPKMERFFRKLIQKAYVAAQNRIMNNFTLSAKENYLQFKAQYPTIHQRVPQYMIASYLGVTPEFLSKIRHQIIAEQ